MAKINAWATLRCDDSIHICNHYQPGTFKLALFSTPYPKTKGFNLSVFGYLGRWLPTRLDSIMMVMDDNSVIMQNIWFPRTEDGWFDTRIFEIPKMYEERGWHMIDPHPWDKINAPPAGNHKRYDHNEFEFIFTFANGPDYVYHKYRRPYRTKTRSKAASGNMRKPSISGNHAGGHANLNPKGAAQSNIYRFSPTGGREVQRPRVDDGVFPMALAARAIQQYSNPGDTIIDPFFGSGTTIVQAVINERNAVGYDTNCNNLEIASGWLRELDF